MSWTVRVADTRARLAKRGRLILDDVAWVLLEGRGLYQIKTNENHEDMVHWCRENIPDNFRAIRNVALIEFRTRNDLILFRLNFSEQLRGKPMVEDRPLTAILLNSHISAFFAALMLLVAMTATAAFLFR